MLAGVLALGGCKLTVVVDPGGQVFSASGDYSCAGGSTSCPYTVPDTGPFVESFAATANPGYKFAGWEGCGKNDQKVTCNVFLNADVTASELEGSITAHFNRPIVGTWIVGNVNVAGQFAVGTFYESGYYIISESCPEDGGTNGAGGYEHGSYTWNATTGALTTTVISDSIGDCGARDLGNAANFDKALVVGDEMVLVAGNGFEAVLRRLVPGSDNVITGTWLAGDLSQVGGFAQLTILNGSRYLVSEECQDNAGGALPPGLEYGTYTWDKATNAFSNNTPILDTMGECGLYDAPGSEGPITNVERRGRKLVLVTPLGNDELNGLF